MRWCIGWVAWAGMSLAIAHAQEYPAIPLGIYWAGETTFQELEDETARWARIELALDDLAAHSVNAIWLTHLSTEETARFAESAALRGISLVAAPNEISGNSAKIRNGDHAAIISQALATWGDAPGPLAWGLADEPKTEYMAEMAAYVDSWHAFAPEEPVTTVVTWGDLQAAGEAGFDRLACDVYPFDPTGYSYSTEPWNAWLSISRRNVRAHHMPWMMGQCFQQPTGNFTADIDGNIIYLRGGRPTFIMPTPEQVSWQAWSGLAEGARGVFFFWYRGPNVMPRLRLPPWAINSRSPWGMTYPDGTSTPQYEALGRAFEQIEQLQPTLARLEADPNGFAQLRRSTPDSRVVRTLRDVVTRRRYLLTVGGYEDVGISNLIVQLGPNVERLIRVMDGLPVPLTVSGDLMEAQLWLPPGEGDLYLLVEDPTNEPTVYRDDFFTRKAANDCDVIRQLRRFPSNLHDYVVSATNSAAWPNNFATYDLDALLEPLSQDGFRVLSYRGHAEPPESRGVLWSTSSNGASYTDISQNQFEQAVIFEPQYLRTSISWSGAANYQYGYLVDFGVWQWPRRASAAKSRVARQLEVYRFKSATQKLP